MVGGRCWLCCDDISGYTCRCWGWRAERAQVWAWMEQSQKDAQRFGDGVPTVIFRRSRSKWLICMELSDFLTFYQAAESGENRKK